MQWGWKVMAGTVEAPSAEVLGGDGRDSGGAQCSGARR